VSESRAAAAAARRPGDARGPAWDALALGLRQTGALAKRSILDTLRVPQAWFPSLFFPLLLLAIFTGSFAAAPGAVPGFPEVAGFLDFAVAGSVLQGVLIGGTTAGAAFAGDIEGGFFDRLVASPVARTAILTGRLAGGVALGLVQTLLFVGVALAFGAEIQSGLPGLLVVLVLAALMATAVGGMGVLLALRTGSAEAVQGTFPLIFALLFFSSAFFPRETMHGWFKAVADANPISHLVEAMRAQVIGDLDLGAALTGLGIAAGLATLTVAASGVALRRRLAGDG
jgi:ABC-2 type transport system permease protein